MSACNFSIPFSSEPDVILNKAKSTIEQQGGQFTGDLKTGNFKVTVFGNTIAGSYQVVGQVLNLVVDEKPFLIPCSTIESFLISKLS